MMTQQPVHENLGICKITLVTADTQETCQFTLARGAACMLGREDIQIGIQPMVDLNAFGGYRLGVSRMHATVRLSQDGVHITDYSSNGTLVNGKRLVHGEQMKLQTYDELRLGDLRFYVYLQRP